MTIMTVKISRDVEFSIRLYGHISHYKLYIWEG